MNPVNLKTLQQSTWMAVHSHREIKLAWRELQDDEQWQMGWEK
jgi:hypothetical protein